MTLQTDGYEFDFPKAKALYKFDEPDDAQPYFHGVSHAMKAVDVMAELVDRYLFIEIKRYDSGFTDGHTADDAKNYLVNTLVTKFRDTFLYRYCEEKLDKPVVFICLIDKLDSAMLSALRKDISRKIPVGIPAILQERGRWKKPLLEEGKCFVVDAKQWNVSNLAKSGSCKYVDITHKAIGSGPRRAKPKEISL